MSMPLPQETPQNQKPRVLIINRVYPPARSSSGRLARELARALARDGRVVDVLTTDPQGDDDYDGPVMVHRLAAKDTRLGGFGGMFLLLRMFFAGLRGARPQVIITMTDPPMVAVVGAVLAILRRAKHIHWVQDVYPDVFPVAGVWVPKFVYRMLHGASRCAMNRASLVVVTGRCVARYLSQNGVDRAKLCLIPNWPELSMNPNATLALPQGRVVDTDVLDAVAQASLMGPVPKFRVMYVGTVSPAHPVDTVFDAATILDSMHPEIEFIFIGSEATHKMINEEKARRGLSNIRVLPFQPHAKLRAIMESGDVHLISMRDDAGGLMVPAKFYAMLSAARPVILVGPEGSEIGRTITDYGAGAVVPERAAHLLAQTIIDYRMREDVWFAAHEGAARAAQSYLADDMLRLWGRKVREMIGC